MKKLILGCLLALFASGCNDNEPEQKPVELKISFAGENPVEFTVGEQKRLAFTVTGDEQPLPDHIRRSGGADFRRRA